MGPLHLGIFPRALCAVNDPIDALGEADAPSGEPGSNQSTLRRTVHAAVFNIGFGLIAVSFTLTVTRRLTVTEASDALVSWNVLMIIGAILMQPSEIYAPRLGFEVRALGGGATEIRRSIVVLVGSGMALCLLLLSAWTLLTGQSLGWFGGASAVVLGYAVLYVHRAHQVSLGRFGRLTVTASITGLMAVLLAAAVILLEFGESSSVLFAVVSIVFLVPLFAEILDRTGTPLGLVSGGHSDVRPPLRPLFTTTISLGATSALSLLLLAGGAPVGSVLRMDALTLTSYTVTASVAAVPFIMMSSAMLPILNRSVELVEAGQWTKLPRILCSAVGGSIGAVAVISATSYAVGRTVLETYLGSTLELSDVEVVAVFVGAGLASVSNAPRLMITAIGGATAFNKWLVVTLCVYAAAILSPSGLTPFWRVTCAALAAGGTLTMVGFMVVLRTAKRGGPSSTVHAMM